MSEIMPPPVKERARIPRYVSYIAYVAVVVAIALLALTYFWVNQKADPLTTAKDGPLDVQFQQIKPGDVQYMIFTGCKTGDYTGSDLTLILVGKDVRLTLYRANKDESKKGCYENVRIPAPIPSITGEGKYHVEYRITYEVNPFKKDVLEILNSKEFEVIK